MNRNPDILLGCHSTIFPHGSSGLLFPRRPGHSSKYFVNPRWDNFGPRLGLAYSPNFSDGILHKLFGDAGKSSIRMGYGTLLYEHRGSEHVQFCLRPLFLVLPNLVSTAFSAPFISRQTGKNFGQPFPVPACYRGRYRH